MAHDLLLMLNILSKFQLSSSYGLEIQYFEYVSTKDDRLTELIKNSPGYTGSVKDETRAPKFPSVCNCGHMTHDT